MHASEVLDVLSAVPIHQWAVAGFLAWITQCIYRITLHPLSRYKGPKLAACSSLWFFYWQSHGRFPEECDRLYDKYDTDVLRVAPNQIVFRTATSLKQIVGRHDVYKGNFTTRVIGFHAANVSAIRDPVAHKRRRKQMNPGFSAVTLSKQEPTLVLPLVNKLVEKVTETKGAEFDISAYFDCVTTDIIGKLSFGADFGMLDSPTTHPFLHVLPEAFRVSLIAQAIPEVFKLMDFLYRFGPSFLTPKSAISIREFARKHLDEREERDRQGLDAGRNDIMSVIVDGSAGTEDQIDQKDMLGEAIVLVAAGGDTVATALTMAMFNMLKHPSVFKTLQTQIRATFPSFDEINTKKIASDIPLMDAALNESMRITPVLPGPMWRRCDKDFVVDEHVIPAGTDVGVQRLALTTNKNYFHDPKEFLPQRWLQDKGDNLEASQPFGIGPHTCPGRYLAMVEMRLILAKLLWQFDWELITQEYDNPEFAVVYRSPMRVKATPRAD